MHNIPFTILLITFTLLARPVSISAQTQTIQRLQGDANGDDMVTIADVTAMVDYLSNPSTRLQHFDAADMDGDKEITTDDVNAVVSLLLRGKQQYYYTYQHQGHEYIDLGLSVKWATCNVGALSPNQSGGYYAWGETEEKDQYSWTTYAHCEGSYYNMTKYNSSTSYGQVDNKSVLEADDDVAHVKWQGNWRMPTSYEIWELRNRCNWEWKTNYQHSGINGYLVTSAIRDYEDRSIFIPAAGYMYSYTLYDYGTYGEYWSSTVRPTYYDDACTLYFNSRYNIGDYCNRYCGYTVRPVFK